MEPLHIYKTDVCDLKLDNRNNLIQNMHKLTMKSNFANIVFDFMSFHMLALAESNAPSCCIHTACQMWREN